MRKDNRFSWFTLEKMASDQALVRMELIPVRRSRVARR